VKRSKALINEDSSGSL